jgi:hypothetical protein
MTKPVRQVLAENVKALRERHPELGGLRPWSKRVGVGEATLVRILQASADVRLESVEAVARGFGVPAWMLLVEGLDPANLPVALSSVERDFYRRLQAAAKSAA